MRARHAESGPRMAAFGPSSVNVHGRPRRSTASTPSTPSTPSTKSTKSTRTSIAPNFIVIAPIPILHSAFCICPQPVKPGQSWSNHFLTVTNLDHHEQPPRPFCRKPTEMLSHQPFTGQIQVRPIKANQAKSSQIKPNQGILLCSPHRANGSISPSFAEAFHSAFCISCAAPLHHSITPCRIQRWQTPSLCVIPVTHENLR